MNNSAFAESFYHPIILIYDFSLPFAFDSFGTDIVLKYLLPLYTESWLLQYFQFGSIFIRQWITDMLSMLKVAYSILFEILSRIRQRQIAIWTASYLISIMTILPIIFPKTDRVYLIIRTPMERFIRAARTSYVLIFFSR